MTCVASRIYSTVHKLCAFYLHLDNMHDHTHSYLYYVCCNSLPVPQQGFTCLHYKESLESIDIVAYLVHNGTPVDMPSKVCIL